MSPFWCFFEPSVFFLLPTVIAYPTTDAAHDEKGMLPSSAVNPKKESAFKMGQFMNLDQAITLRDYFVHFSTYVNKTKTYKVSPTCLINRLLKIKLFLLTARTN